MEGQERPLKTYSVPQMAPNPKHLPGAQGPLPVTPNSNLSSPHHLKAHRPVGESETVKYTAVIFNYGYRNNSSWCVFFFSGGPQVCLMALIRILLPTPQEHPQPNLLVVVVVVLTPTAPDSPRWSPIQVRIRPDPA